MLTPPKRIDKLVFLIIGYILTAELIQYGTKIVGYGYVTIWTKSIVANFKVLTGNYIKSFTQSRNKAPCKYLIVATNSRYNYKCYIFQMALQP
jgi:hypothetical protein